VATALQHGSLEIPGVVLDRGQESPGVVIGPRDLQQRTTQFWGVRGESRINGYPKGRNIAVTVLVYEEDDFETRAELSTYLAQTINTDHLGEAGTVTITSESGWPTFENCIFEGAQVLQGPKLDVASIIGGGAWAIVLFTFRQLSATETPPEEP